MAYSTLIAIPLNAQCYRVHSIVRPPCVRSFLRLTTSFFSVSFSLACSLLVNSNACNGDVMSHPDYVRMRCRIDYHRRLCSTIGLQQSA